MGGVPWRISCCGLFPAVLLRDLPGALHASQKLPNPGLVSFFFLFYDRKENYRPMASYSYVSIATASALKF